LKILLVFTGFGFGFVLLSLFLTYTYLPFFPIFFIHFLIFIKNKFLKLHQFENLANSNFGVGLLRFELYS